MKRFQHVLAVGGTGMLRGAVIDLAGRSRTVTSLARTRSSLDLLEAVLPRTGLNHLAIPVDWDDRAGFSAAIEQAVETHGAPDLVLVWIHRRLPALRIARQLARVDRPMRFLRVLGSQSASPNASLAEDREEFEALPALTYHQIVLGFTYEKGRSRWLTHAEISTGAILAVDDPWPVHIVGTVDPWSDRP